MSKRILACILVFVLCLTALPALAGGCPKCGSSDYKLTKTDEGSCTDSGSEYWSCSACGYVRQKATSPLGHNWGGYRYSSKPTCTTGGTGTRTCKRCGATEQGTFAALGHDFSWNLTPSTCTTEGTKTGTCDRCGYVWTSSLPAAGHKLTAWSVQYNATQTTAGRRERHCSQCGLGEYEFFLKDGTAFTLHEEAVNYDGKTPFMSGDTIEYSVLLVNTGSRVMKNVCIMDSRLNSSETAAAFKPGEKLRVTYEYTVTAEDALKGYVSDAAVLTWHGANASQDYVTTANDVTVPAQPSEKDMVTVSQQIVNRPEEGCYTPDDTVTLNITVANNTRYEMTLRDVSLSFEGSFETLQVSGDIISLAPCSEQVITAEFKPSEVFPYLTDGDITGTASVLWVYIDETFHGTSVSGSFTVKVETPEPALKLGVRMYTDDPAGRFTRGETASVLAETGNTGLEPVLIQSIQYIDPQTAETLVELNPDKVLEPGETYTVEYVCTVEDAGQGYAAYCAEVLWRGTGADDPVQTAVSNTLTIDCRGIAADISVEEYISNTPENGIRFTADEAIIYGINIINDSDFPLTNVRITDENTGIYELIDIIPAHSTVNTDGIYVVTEDDCAEGSLLSCASVSCTADESQLTVLSNPVSAPLGVKTAASNIACKATSRIISAPANGMFYTPGEKVSCIVTFTNTGSVTVSNLRAGYVALLPSGIINLTAEHTSGVASGKYASFMFDYTVTPCDCTEGCIYDSAFVEYTANDGTRGIALTEENKVFAYVSDTYTLDSLQLREFEVSSPRNGESYTAGETVRFMLMLYNPTAYAWSDIKLYSILSASSDGLIISEGTLEPGAYLYADLTYTVTKSDESMGSAGSLAWATAKQSRTGVYDTLLSNEVKVPCGKLAAKADFHPDFCSMTTVMGSGGAELTRTDMCNAHHALMQAEDSLSDPAEIADMWLRNVITMYSVLIVRTGSEALIKERSLFIEDINCLRQLTGEAGLSAVTGLLRDRASELCALAGGNTNRMAVSSCSLPEASGARCTYSALTGASAWYQTYTCPAALHIAGEAEADTGEFWMSALTSVCASSALSESFALFAMETDARTAALGELLPHDPGYTKLLLIRELKNRLAVYCSMAADASAD